MVTLRAETGRIVTGYYLESWDRQESERAAPAPDMRNLAQALLLGEQPVGL
jgi:hypothetical protein